MGHPTYFNDSPLFPNPLVCAKDIVEYGFHEINVRLPWNGIGPWVQETLDWIQLSIRPDLNVLIWPMVICLVFTVVRVFLNRVLFTVSLRSRHLVCYTAHTLKLLSFFHSQKIPVWFKLNETSSEKFPESLWKFIVYSITWGWSIYLVFFKEEPLFFNLQSQWTSESACWEVNVCLLFYSTHPISFLPLSLPSYFSPSSPSLPTSPSLHLPPSLPPTLPPSTRMVSRGAH